MRTKTTGPSDWTSTPEHRETVYALCMDDTDGGFDQYFELTRDEFEGLKLHLAKLRGIETTAAA
ncbi:MAG: hypothetical protein IH602_09100 [Bryobacteraceae bacterium]|nr:hypothetical protein [Bryobacteraceae bacterium]